ncbi:coiled-coil domain-containing protein [Limnoglobus roseus]|uniref:Uncharacterized protein n=1 Tax=Limnoglobus roseus TaxID=2598579 RepID=A0A5C1A5N4_9BACT|nr:hypothetical protein [Limnoglobus roseus]QEL14381.1 hypothetical protein PX52LOC_01269 [Limnoglobus roseus]
MIRTYKVLLIVGLTVFGVWGCGKSGIATTGERETNTAKVAKLEEELKATSAARDTFRQKLAQAEEQLRAEAARGLAIQKERDNLNVQLKEKGQEYKELLAQYDSFRKNLKDLIGQAEVAIAPKPQGVSATPVSLSKGESKSK